MSEQKIILTLDRIEEDKVVLRTDDGQEIIIGINFVPNGVGEGDKLFMSLSLSAEQTASAKLSARDLIKAILGNNKNND